MIAWFQCLVRRSSTWGTAACALLLGAQCTRLESPNDLFPVTGRDPRGGVAGATANELVAGRIAYAGNEASSLGGAGGGGRIEAQGGTSSNLDLAGFAGAVNTAGAAGDSCWVPDGQNGLGCLRCRPTEIVGFERACTTASCVPFDNRKRLSKLQVDGSLPPLPLTSNGSASLGTETSGISTGGGGGVAPSTVAGASAGGAAQAGAANTAAVGGASSGKSLCSQLGGKTVLVTGSSAARPYLEKIAQQLAISGIYLVYVSSGSCAGVDAIVNRSLVRTGAPPLPASATYWDGISSTGKACQLPPEGLVADIGVSDVFAQTCPGFELASLDAHQVRDAHGPIQTMAFVVPTTSRYMEISAQAAYFVFGFGAEGGVLDPTTVTGIWNDESSVFIRGASSGTQAMLAAAIGVPSSRFRGRMLGSSDDVADNLQAALGDTEAASKAIGILAADYLDSKNLRGVLRMLAYQDTNQLCAFYPDSSLGARDKRNVRDGHYPIWSPLHLLYRTDSSGLPEHPESRQQILDILGYLSGSKPLPVGIPLLGLYAQNGLVPECAMRVTRTKDGGNLVPFTPSSPCACAFEAATGTTNCRPCAVQGDCAAGENCSAGYCEP